MEFDETRISEFAGFIYEIRHRATGRAYIGRKYLQARRNGRTVESNWRIYWGSSEALALDLKRFGKAAFERRILSLHATRAETDFAEERELWRRDVLAAVLPDGSAAFYNRQIGARWYRVTVDRFSGGTKIEHMR
ncbi:hypothetical protein Q0812_10195 [Brevundimonas sp. 2R-24]|uniref:Putative endonuclease SegE-like GIY-YIG domain-containing protein n=1 Tax=Peiella sedimenti TaxID=3061083 RepID=A0ABT8SMJ7_9CAUL|nr:hypothetical protein [Caulobacteraceae bacterium XZ-24]